MLRLFKILALIFIVSAMPACTSSQAIYEGIKNNNDAQRSPNERAINPAPSYEQYKRERETVTH